MFSSMYCRGAKSRVSFKYVKKCKVFPPSAPQPSKRTHICRASLFPLVTPSKIREKKERKPHLVSQGKKQAEKAFSHFFLPNVSQIPGLHNILPGFACTQKCTKSSKNRIFSDFSKAHFEWKSAEFHFASPPPPIVVEENGLGWGWLGTRVRN